MIDKYEYRSFEGGYCITVVSHPCIYLSFQVIIIVNEEERGVWEAVCLLASGIAENNGKNIYFEMLKHTTVVSHPCIYLSFQVIIIIQYKENQVIQKKLKCLFFSPISFLCVSWLISFLMNEANIVWLICTSFPSSHKREYSLIIL